MRLEKELEAEEAARAYERDLDKLRQQHANDLEKLEKEHALSLDTAEDSALTELQKARWQTESELGKLFHQTIAEVSKGSIDRSRDSARYVQTAAAAIAALYSGLLGLVFSVTSNPLPVRGVYAGVFLGLSVALATAYLAFITRPPAPHLYAGGASLAEMQLNRTGFLTKWVNASVHGRRWAIRASVLSLGIGVAFIPAPFVAASRTVEVPPAPVAPSIPSQVPSALASDALHLFRAQIKSYNAAVFARNAAIAKSAATESAAAKEDADANRLTLLLAILAVIVVLMGPWLVDRIDNRRSRG